MRTYRSRGAAHASVSLRSVHPSGGYFILREQIVFLWPNTQWEVKYESLLTKGPFVLLLCFNGGEATIYRQRWQDGETASLEFKEWILVHSVHWMWPNRKRKEWVMVLKGYRGGQQRRHWQTEWYEDPGWGFKAQCIPVPSSAGRRGPNTTLSCQHIASTHFITPQPRCSSSERDTSISSIVIPNCSNQPESHAGQQTACLTEPEAEKKGGKSVFSTPLVSFVSIFLTEIR